MQQSQFFYALTTPPPTVLMFKIKLSHFGNFFSTIRHNCLLSEESKFQVHWMDSNNKFVPRASVLSPFPFCKYKWFCVWLWQCPFSGLISATSFSISRRHAEMAFVAAFFSNVVFSNYSYSILRWFNSSSKRSCSASLLSSEARVPLLRATLAKGESILTFFSSSMTPVVIPSSDPILENEIITPLSFILKIRTQRQRDLTRLCDQKKTAFVTSSLPVHVVFVTIGQRGLFVLLQSLVCKACKRWKRKLIDMNLHGIETCTYVVRGTHKASETRSTFCLQKYFALSDHKELSIFWTICNSFPNTLLATWILKILQKIDSDFQIEN